VRGFARWRDGLSASRSFFSEVAPSFIVSLRKPHENLSSHGCRTVPLFATGVALAQSGRMMDGNSWGVGWMGGYGGIWLPIFLVAWPSASSYGSSSARGSDRRRRGLRHPGDAQGPRQRGLGEASALGRMACRGIAPDSPPNRYNSEPIEHPRDRACGQLLRGMKDETR